MAFAVSYGVSVPFFQRENGGQQQAVALQKDRHEMQTDSTKRMKKPLWRVQRTQPITWTDLDSSALDLQTPQDLRNQVSYNDSLNAYFIGRRLGGTYLSAPVMMLPNEYLDWSGRQQQHAFSVKKMQRYFNRKGKISLISAICTSI